MHRSGDDSVYERTYRTIYFGNRLFEGVRVAIRITDNANVEIELFDQFHDPAVSAVDASDELQNEVGDEENSCDVNIENAWDKQQLRFA